MTFIKRFLQLRFSILQGARKTVLHLQKRQFYLGPYLYFNESELNIY